MAARRLGFRVDSLEKTVRTLAELPAQVARLDERVGRVELQIVEFRTEMRDGFSAMRAEMATKADLAEVRKELKADLAAHREETKVELAAVREEMATKADLTAHREETRADLAAHREETKSEFAALREEVVQGDQETRRYMRMLFEDYVGRRRIIREGDPEP